MQILFIGVSNMLMRLSLLILLMACNVSYAGLFGNNKASEQIDALQSEVESMDVRVIKMEDALKSQALLELYAQVEILVLEQGKLRGQIETLNNQNASLQKRQRDFYVDLDNRLRRIEDPNAPLATIMPEVTMAAEVPESEPVASLQSSPITQVEPASPKENDEYEAANSLFRNGDYAGAISKFEVFLNNHPASSLAPGAAYWIGNAHYALRDFSEAIDAQRRLISIYPNSDKVPDALLNIASSQQEMTDSKAAKGTLQDLIAKYPFSNAAEKAKQRLANY